MPTVWFDMDGTIADFYNVTDWLDSLIHEDTAPYDNAKPITITNSTIKVLKRMGYKIGIITWGSRNSSEAYLKKVKAAKIAWLKRHFPTIDGPIIVVHHGTPKSKFKAEGDYLIDDEKQNRLDWGSGALSPEEFAEMVA